MDLLIESGGGRSARRLLFEGLHLVEGGLGFRAGGSFLGQGHSQLLGIRSQRWFVVHARAGQTMIVIVEGRGPTRGTVFFPGGGSDGQPGGRVFDASVPRTGDYRIRVTESPMGQGWSGRVDVVVVIY